MNNIPFFGTRLTCARNRKGSSMQDIADLIGVQRQYIHKIETGKENKSLSSEQIDIIANHLDVLPEYFFHEKKISIGNERLHFRSLSLPKYVKEQAKVIAEDVISVCSFVNEFIANLGLSFPNFTLDEVADTINIKTDALYEQEIERVSLRVREVLRLGDGPVANMVRVLETQGIIVTEFDNISNKVDAFCNDDYYPVVVRNIKKSPVRCRFDLGHELAHLILHKGVDNDIVNNPFLEKQANYFASSFLLPRKAFINEFPRFSANRIPWSALIALKGRWKVSIAAMVKRAFDLKIIDSRTYKSFFMQLSMRGYKTKEPLDTEGDNGYVPLEQPELLRSAVTMIKNTHRNMLSEMKEELKLNNDTLRRSLGMPELKDEDFGLRQRPALYVVK